MMNVDTMKICMEKNFFSMIENKQEKRQHFFSTHVFEAWKVEVTKE